MGVIISGVSNIGKSYISNNSNISSFDLDTTYFKKLPGSNWEEVYVECARGLSEIYDYVFITTYGEPLQIMNKRGIKYYLVYPERELKEELQNLRNELAELRAQRDKLARTALAPEPSTPDAAPATWQDAVAKVGYEEARRRFPRLYADFMKKYN